MNFLSDIITYVRRIIKSPSNAAITDSLIIDYINRFWLMDVDARIQTFDFKTKYAFQTTPGVDQYNMPLYNTNAYPSQNQPGNQLISYYPVYQGFRSKCWVDGIQVPFYNDLGSFFNIWPNYVQENLRVGRGDGVTTTFVLQVPFLTPFPPNPGIIYPHTPYLLRGHVDNTGIISAQVTADPIIRSFAQGPITNDPAVSGQPYVPLTSTFPGVYVTSIDNTNAPINVMDNGQFASTNQNLGFLVGDVAGGYAATTNVVNYVTGTINVTFDTPPAAHVPINIQCYYIQPGIPRAICFYNNILTVRPPPNISYLVELEAYLSPAAFLSTGQSAPFAYMCEYIARGAARKILADTGDVEQFQFYEPLFKEQETLVWKRSQRQVTATRTGTIFSESSSQSPSNNYAGGGN